MLGVWFSICQFTICEAGFGGVTVIEIDYINKLDSQIPLYFILSNMNMQINNFVPKKFYITYVLTNVYVEIVLSSVFSNIFLFLCFI